MSDTSKEHHSVKLSSKGIDLGDLTDERYKWLLLKALEPDEVEVDSVLALIPKQIFETIPKKTIEIFKNRYIALCNMRCTEISH